MMEIRDTHMLNTAHHVTITRLLFTMSTGSPNHYVSSKLRTGTGTGTGTGTETGTGTGTGTR